MIEVRNLSFGYSKNRQVLKDVSFNAGKGEIVNILGPNGCGKSTLIKIILGFLSVKRGMVKIDGRDAQDIKRHEMASLLSYVPQLHSGVFSYTVLDVVLMGRITRSPWYKYTDKDYEIAYAALDRVRLRKFADRSYLHLSGGERQLVLIARALTQNSTYFIMDEPVTGLDYGNQFLLLQVIKELSEEGLSFLLTTHHPEHAVFLGGRALLIKDGQLMGDGIPYEVITTNCICNLYNMPRELVEKFSDMHYTRKLTS
jgi:iron complex transport system ATP-binding protein